MNDRKTFLKSLAGLTTELSLAPSPSFAKENNSDRLGEVLYIKSLADRRFFANKKEAGWTSDDPIIPNYLSIKEAIHFVWSLPVTVNLSK